MLKKLLNGQINSITVAALLVALSSLVSRFLGIFRDRILAGEFGAGDTLDIYYAAFRIPDLVFNLLVLGAISAGFIPIFTGLIKEHSLKDYFGFEKNKKAWQLASNILNILTVSLVALSAIGIIFAPLIMKAIVPGFSPEKQALTAQLARVMFLSPIFLGMSSILGGILQSFRKFFVYSLSPILYNIGIIIGALYFVPYWGAYGLAWGVVLGAFLHFLIQIPAVVSLGFKYSLVFELKSQEVRKVIMMMIPRTLSLAVSQLNLVVITIIASVLADGSLAIFNFANNLQIFPVGIFGISYAIAAFPALSAVAFDRQKIAGAFSTTLRQILFFIIPSTVLLLALRAQIVRVILGTGEFDWAATVLTIDTIGFFTLSLFAQALIPLQVRVFYARHNTAIPFYAGLASAAINIVLSYYFSRTMGVAGLALSFSIAAIANFIFLWIAMRTEIGEMNEMRILVSSIKFSIAAIAAGLAVQGMKLLILPYIDMTKLWGVFLQGASAGIAGIAVYMAFCALLRSEEFYGFWCSIKRRLPWKKVEVGDQGEARGI